MNKINGYTEEEAKSFVQYVYNGKRAGKTLTSLFNGYAKKSGRAQGSVRNYYYSLLKHADDKEVKRLLKGTNLKAENGCAFTEEETDKILRAIVTEKSRGISVRHAVQQLAGGDSKLMLRYQNKYRNLLAHQPERVQKMMRECGLKCDDNARAQVEREINGLYDRLADSLKQENARLTAMVKRLSEENALLKLQVKNLQRLQCG